MERTAARRRPGRPQREIGGIEQRPWKQLTRPYAPIEILSADQVFTEFPEQRGSRQGIRRIEFIVPPRGEPAQGQRIGVRVMHRRGSQVDDLLAFHLPIPPSEPASRRIEDRHL